MRSEELVYRGRHLTTGLLVDSSLVGEAVAKQRILERWATGDRLYGVPGNRWFVKFASPEDVTNSATTGVLVVDQGDEGLSASPMSVGHRGQLTYWDGGEERSVPVSSLQQIDPGSWISFATPVRVLETPTLPAPSPKVVEPAEVEEPNLRERAAVGSESTKANKVVEELKQQAAKAKKQSDQARDKAQRKTGDGSSTGIQPHVKHRKKNDFWARLAIRTPLRNEIARKHMKYIDELTQKFTSGDLDEALRHAIPLGGLGSAGLSLQLPSRRSLLELTGGQSGGRAFALGGENLQGHLNTLYTQAADELERAGRIDEAAFVYAELLNRPEEAVALLERHKQFETAAAFSEARELDADLIIRLWWLAGDREHAMQLARKSHSYELVLKFLGTNYPEEAREFRLLWMNDLERSGNFHAAVAVGWADPHSRVLLTNLIRKGIDANDEWSLGMRAFEVALRPSQDNRASLIQALHDPTTSDTAIRHAVIALAKTELADLVVDREICTNALRVAFPLTFTDQSFSAALGEVADRADKVLGVDQPARRNRPEHSTLTIPPQPNGSRRVHDVVPLSNGQVLLALGESGVRLVSADGRTGGEWSVPCTQLVSSDVSKSALLLTERGAVTDVHILDLVTRKVRHYGPIKSMTWASSFDGATWVVADDRGLAFLDMLAESPTTVWRELEPGWVCYRLSRSAGSLAAVVALAPDPDIQVWRWELPTRRLDERRNVSTPEAAVDFHLFSDGNIVWEREALSPVMGTPDGRQRELPSAVAISVSETTAGLQRTSEIVELRDSSGVSDLTVRWAVGEGWSFRSSGSWLALWTDTGAVTVVERVPQRVRSTFVL